MLANRVRFVTLFESMTYLETELITRLNVACIGSNSSSVRSGTKMWLFEKATFKEFCLCV